MRSLARRPIFVLVVVLTLSLGVGANVAVFSLVDAVLLKPLPGVRDTGNIVDITRDLDGQYFDISFPVFTDLRAESTVLEDLAAVTFVPVAIGIGTRSEVVGGYAVTGNYFALLGTRPAMGRLLLPSEALFPQVEPVVVLSHRFWQGQLDGRVDVVGHTVRVNGIPVEIVGVAEPGFGGHAAALKADVWVPLGLSVPGLPAPATLLHRDSGIIETIGRLQTDVDVARASVALSVMADTLFRVDHPEFEPGSYVVRVTPFGPVPAVLRSGVTIFMTVLMVLMALVLSVACVNVIGMLLSRASERSREIAIRLALGAGRRRLVSQLLTESVVIFLGAGLCGLALGRAVVPLLAAFRPPIPLPGVDVHIDTSMDLRVLAFALAVSAGTGIVFGLIPALRAVKTDLQPALHGARASAAPRASRLRAVLTAGQMAATLVLLVVAALFLRALHSDQLNSLGFDAQRVETIAFDLELNGYDDLRGQDFYAALLARTRTLPDVESAAVARKLPLGGRSSFGLATADGVEPPPDAGGFLVSHNIVSSGYFRTLRMPLVAGRDLDPLDTPAAARVAIVNRALARRIWNSDAARAIGRRFTYGGREIEVIGVTADAPTHRPAEQAGAFIYLAAAQYPNTEMTLHVRVRRDNASAIPAVRSIVNTLDDGVPVLRAQQLSDALQIFILPQRLAAWVSGVVGALGLLLGLVGVAGTAAYAATQRRREIAVRLAVGASPGSVLALMVRHGMLAPAVGMTLGLAISAAAARVIASIITGVNPLDPVAFGTVLLVLGAAATLANVLPAHRVARQDPMLTLRQE